jgi:Rrf2 family iron-sulfur cluster assembly transcriptional regulator
MPLLARKSILAICAVVEIAIAGRTRPLTAKALAQRYGLPVRHLEPALQALVRQGILKGIRGPRGGYELSREKGRISVDQILRAAESAEEADAASLGSSPLLEQVVIPALQSAERVYSAALALISVDDLAAPGEELRRSEEGPEQEQKPWRDVG